MKNGILVEKTWVAVVLMAWVLVGSSSGATINVSGGTGLAAAVAGASAGDTVDIVDNLTYAESAIITVDNLTLTSSGGGTITTPSGGGLGFGSSVIVMPGVTSATVTNLTVNGSAGIAVALLSDNCTLTVDQCTLTGNGSPGVGGGVVVIDFAAPFSGISTINISNSVLDGNVGSGIGLFTNTQMSGTGSVVVNVSNTSVSGNSGDGITIQASGASTAIHTSNNCNIDNNLGSGVHSDSPVVSIDLNDTTLNGQTYGVVVLGSSTGTALALTDSTASGNSQVGVWIQPGSSGTTIDVTNSSLTGNALNGLRLDGDAVVTLNDVHLDSNTGAGLEVNAAAPGSIDAVSTTLSNNGTNALLLAAGTTHAVTMTSCLISGNAARSLQLNGTETTLLINSTIQGNATGGDTQTVATNGGTLVLDGCLVDDSATASGDGMVIWTGSTLTAIDTQFRNVTGGTIILGPGGVTATLTSCTFDKWGWAAINVREGAEATLTDCVFLDDPANTNDVIFRTQAFGGVNDSTITVTGGTITCSNLLRVGGSDDVDSTVSFTNVSISHPTDCGNSITFDGTAELRLTMSGCDVNGNGTPNVFLFETHGASGQDVRLNPGTFEHCTFTAFANAFVFDGNMASTVTFDQCDFFAMTPTSIWVRDAANTGAGDSDITLDIVDSIFEDSTLYVFGPTATVTEDFNLIGNNAAFSAQFGATIASGGNTITDPAGPQYLDTTFGNPNYLVLNTTSPALGVNSGNGPENHLGAKGALAPPVGSSVRNWELLD